MDMNLSINPYSGSRTLTYWRLFHPKRIERLERLLPPSSTPYSHWWELRFHLFGTTYNHPVAFWRRAVIGLSHVISPTLGHRAMWKLAPEVLCGG